MSRPFLAQYSLSGMRGSEHRLPISDLSLNAYGRSLFRQDDFFRSEITGFFKIFRQTSCLIFFASALIKSMHAT
jgi:hypothetical protein